MGHFLDERGRKNQFSGPFPEAPHAPLESHGYLTQLGSECAFNEIDSKGNRSRSKEWRKVYFGKGLCPLCSMVQTQRRSAKSPRKPGEGHRDSERMRGRWMGQQIREGIGLHFMKNEPQYIVVHSFGQKLCVLLFYLKIRGLKKL